jgi:hypothetical protein
MRLLGTCWERWDKAASSLSFTSNSIFDDVLAQLDGGAVFDTWKPFGDPVNGRIDKNGKERKRR